MKVKTEDRAFYAVPGQKRDSDDVVIATALSILSARLRKPGEAMTSPQTIKDFLRLKLAEEEREVFSVIWLDAQNRMIEYMELFAGTLTQAAVYPREVVKDGLAHNAAACFLSHNHPSGIAEASRADIALTDILKAALALVDIKVLDHIIIGGPESLSFAERGLI